MSNLKLFVWNNVLTNYLDGVMFALAENAEQAKEEILRISQSEDIEEIKQELEKPYMVFDYPAGFYLHGSE